MTSRAFFGPSSMIFRCLKFLLNIWLLCVAAVIPRSGMTTLDFNFTLFAGDQPIAPGPDGSGVQATLGLKPAVFTLKDGRLSSEDRFLGPTLWTTYDYMPQPIFWWQKDTPESSEVDWVAQKHGDSYQLLEFGSPLIAIDGEIYENIRPDTPTFSRGGVDVVLKPVTEEREPEK
ncbi:hypothetical protein F5X68DRAFT_236956 [Plectosphaerella plurivora]|uniref:Uncharacterized protein n=1 Tax=Plectosphaerella plurivora TaxID=936078 RepID=A0A9P9A5V3_9PEZI|nr:hypothetical protein F5X68DRAFT_236956 [Plectosphaerella plurivora]